MVFSTFVYRYLKWVVFAGYNVCSTVWLPDYQYLVDTTQKVFSISYQILPSNYTLESMIRNKLYLNCFQLKIGWVTEYSKTPDVEDQGD